MQFWRLGYYLLFLLFFGCFGCQRGEKPVVTGYFPTTGPATGFDNGAEKTPEGFMEVTEQMELPF